MNPSEIKGVIDEKARDPKIVEMMKKVRMEADPALSPDGYTGAATVVSLRLKDGTILSQRVDQPKGAPENPVMREELLNKFRNCASTCLNEDSIERIVDKIIKIEQLDTIKPLMEELTGLKNRNEIV